MYIRMGCSVSEMKNGVLVKGFILFLILQRFEGSRVSAELHTEVNGDGLWQRNVFEEGHFDVIAGKSISLLCNSNNTLDHPAWKCGQDGATEQECCSSNNIENGVHRCLINNLEATHSKNYTCHTPTQQSSVYLSVYSGSSSSTSIVERSLRIETGAFENTTGLFSWTILFRAYPNPLFEWNFHGHPIEVFTATDKHIHGEDFTIETDLVNGKVLVNIVKNIIKYVGTHRINISVNDDRTAVVKKLMRITAAPEQLTYNWTVTGNIEVTGKAEVHISCEAWGNPLPVISLHPNNCKDPDKCQVSDQYKEKKSACQGTDCKYITKSKEIWTLSKNYSDSFTCHASNNLGTLKSDVFNISEIPFSFTNKLECSYNVHEDDTLVLRCSLPPGSDSRVYWMKSSKELVVDDHYIMNPSEGTLVIHKVIAGVHDGQYECYAEHRGHLITQTTTVTVTTNYNLIVGILIGVVALASIFILFGCLAKKYHFERREPLLGSYNHELDYQVTI